MSWAFYPLAYILGVTDGEQTMKLAQLIGLKTVLNEFIAYQKMSEMLNNHELEVIHRLFFSKFHNFLAPNANDRHFRLLWLFEFLANRPGIGDLLRTVSEKTENFRENYRSNANRRRVGVLYDRLCGR